MKVTLSGQMMLCMLVEAMYQLPNLQIISCNTDGICLYLHRSVYPELKKVCEKWEKLTSLHLEEVRYTKIAVADVNSYLAVYED
jgi:hypothetical protein